jgi:hypothetical protein
MATTTINKSGIGKNGGDGNMAMVTGTKNQDFCRKALPHYLLIFLCRHQEMYYYFVHLLRFYSLA